MMTCFRTIILGGALALGSSNIMAQAVGLEYTTEWHTDFSGNYDWLNLLQTRFEAPLTGGLSLMASTISTAKSGDCSLLDDLLTFSNIEAGNIPLTLAHLGLRLTAGGSELFVGINNVNEDYFTSDMTSFFTNSSCGISPTISCNYDIANYPLAAWCIHYRQRLGCWSLQTSLYPGQGYSRLLGHDNLFSLNLKRDGIFSISSIDYKKNGLYCILGVALHYGMCMGDVEAESLARQAAPAQKRLTAAPWLLGEISLPHNLGLLAHGSVSTVRRGCKDYAGMGLIYYGRSVSPGVSLNYASFTGANEYDLELTARIPALMDNAYLQPTLHLVNTDSQGLKCIGMLRLYIEI